MQVTEVTQDMIEAIEVFVLEQFPVTEYSQYQVRQQLDNIIEMIALQNHCSKELTEQMMNTRYRDVLDIKSHLEYMFIPMMYKMTEDL